jgi:hypothetical protein
MKMSDIGTMDGWGQDPTLLAMHKAVEQREAAKPPRNYLGASSIGDSCERKLWYGVQGTQREPIKWQGLYAIEDGHRTEDLIAERLRLVPGIELWTHREDGSQFGFEDFGERFRGHIDGVIRGLLQAPKTPHIWENKSVNEAKFKKFQKAAAEKGEKNALKAWDLIYYAQAVVYMSYFDLTRHYLTVTTPGGRDIASCRTEANPTYAEALREKGKGILNATEPSARVSENPSWWECKFCPFWETCHVVPTSTGPVHQNEW